MISTTVNMVQTRIVTFSNGITINFSWDLHKVDIDHVQQHAILNDTVARKVKHYVF